MVRLADVRNANVELVKRQSLVAVFVGGTAGIGEFGVRRLAATHGEQGKGLRIYIVGRNQKAADGIIVDCQRVCPQGHFRFVPAKDLALLRDVDRVCDEIMAHERLEAEKKGEVARIDFLVMTQGLLNLKRNDTEEGIDESMSLFYYSRMRFAVQLLPLLLNSPLAAHVVSIWSPGREGNIVQEDLSCRKPENFGVRKVSSHLCYMTSFFFEQLASRHPGKLSLSHVYPGAIKTGFGQSGLVPAWLKVFLRFVVVPLMTPIALSHEECGHRVVFLASEKFPARSTVAETPRTNVEEIATGTDGLVGSGAYRINWDGESLPTPASYQNFREEGVSDLVWKHTTTAFDEIASGEVFSG
ncbi:hypothetical protein BJ170DRAFT_263401 [Xylariales sp. AK1849]|nr:hypothetical protein BJ170DRAFT_263401 [Xylariales sp. AK1849]